MTENEIVEIAQGGEAREIRPMLSEGLNVLMELAENADKRVLAMQTLRRASLKLMNKSDWVDQEGRPYPQSSGLEKVADAWGLSWGFLGKPEKIIEQDRYLIVTTLYVESPWGRRIEVVGTRASDDPLYGKVGGALRPLSEIDEGDIRKASYTNALARGVSIMLGLRNLTWEELGVKPDEVQKVERFQKAAPTEDEKALQNEVREILTELSNGDPKAALKLLEETTAFMGKNKKTGEPELVPGVRTFAALTGRRLEVTLGKVKDMKKVRQSEMSDAAEPTG
jgi:hypothetical protein